jgi:FixJ family two-component response regulator
MLSVQQTVIIAEDDSAKFVNLQEILIANGFRVMDYNDTGFLRNIGCQEDLPCVLIAGDVAGVDFFEFLQTSRWEIPTIFLRSGNSIREAVTAIQSGAEDYITRPFCTENLLSVIRRAMLKAAQRMNLPMANRDLLRRASALTYRESEILNLVLAGMLNKQIAEQLGLALVTVKFHRGHAMRKLGARTAAELARFAGAAGINPASSNLNWRQSSRMNDASNGLPQQRQ